MENLKNLEKIAKIFQPQNIITSEEIDQVLKGIMDILASYKKGTDSINEETKAVVNSLLEQTIKYNQETISDFKSEAEKAHSERMKELQGFLSEVKTTLGDMEVMMSEVKDGKDADEERVIEEVINRIKIDPTVVTMSAEEVRDKLASLKGEDRLDKSAIKGLEKVLQQKDLDYAVATLQQQASFLINKGGLKSIVAGTNITVDNTDPSNPIISSTGGGSGSPGGSTTQLQYNNAGSFGGISGATTDGTAVTYTTGNLKGTDIKASTSAGLQILSNNGTVVSLHGAGGGANNTFYGDIKADYATASTVPYLDASKNLISSTVTPTELGYVSGVTSNIQTQLNAKEPTITTLAVNKGGTGQTTYTNGQLLIGNTTGNTLTKATLTGTSNQVVVTNGGGSITLSTPQDIGTSSNPQFATIELGAASDTTLSRVSAGVIAVEGVTVATSSNTLTLTNKRPQPRTASSTTASTLTPDLSSANVYYRTTQTGSLTINAPTGTPVIGETIAIYVDSAGAQTLTMDSTYKVFGAAFPATTTAGKTLMITAQYNGTDWKTLWANAV